jgi:hypothetical protein
MEAMDRLFKEVRKQMSDILREDEFRRFAISLMEFLGARNNCLSNCRQQKANPAASIATSAIDR